MYSALAFVFAAAVSHADVTCVINAENPNAALSFDQLIYKGELSVDKPVAIKADFSVVTGDAVRDEMVKLLAANATPNPEAAPSEFHHALLVVGELQENDNFSIGIGHFDLASKQNLLGTDFVAGGSIKSPVYVIDMAHKLSIYCENAAKTEDAPKAEPAK